MPYEIKYLPKIEKWLTKPKHVAFAPALFQAVVDELSANPFPRLDDGKLIKIIKGLKKNNPKCYRIRTYENPQELIVGEYRFYYTIVTPHKKPENWSGYVVLLEISGPSDEDKKQAVDRLKKVKFTDIETLLG